jgi:tRNA threonylcarbamoyladenosine biosynthesis protein TsaE
MHAPSNSQPVASTAGAVELHSYSPEETRQLGVRLGQLLEPGDVVLLHGNLGAGKTAFAQGIGEGLGVRETINSPTFTLLKEYVGRVPLYHFDLYRIEDADEIYSLGFEDYFAAEGVSVVEWAERGEASGGEAPWSEGWLRICIEQVGIVERVLRCTARGVRAQRLLAALAQTIDDGEEA